LAHLYAVPGLQPPETVLVLPQGRLNAPLQGVQTGLRAQVHLGAGRRLCGQLSAPATGFQTRRQHVPECGRGLLCCLAHRATTSKTSRAIRSIAEPDLTLIFFLKECAGPSSALEYLNR